MQPNELSAAYSLAVTATVARLMARYWLCIANLLQSNADDDVQD